MKNTKRDARYFREELTKRLSEIEELKKSVSFNYFGEETISKEDYSICLEYFNSLPLDEKIEIVEKLRTKGFSVIAVPISNNGDLEKIKFPPLFILSSSLLKNKRLKVVYDNDNNIIDCNLMYEVWVEIKEDIESDDIIECVRETTDNDKSNEGSL